MRIWISEYCPWIKNSGSSVEKRKVRPVKLLYIWVNRAVKTKSGKPKIYSSISGAFGFTNFSTRLCLMISGQKEDAIGLAKCRIFLRLWRAFGL